MGSAGSVALACTCGASTGAGSRPERPSLMDFADHRVARDAFAEFSCDLTGAASLEP